MANKNISYDEFEARKREAIEWLQKLHYENDPHFIVIVGNHQQTQNMVYSCTEWAMSEMASTAKELLLNNMKN